MGNDTTLLESVRDGVSEENPIPRGYFNDLTFE